MFLSRRFLTLTSIDARCDLENSASASGSLALNTTELSDFCTPIQFKRIGKSISDSALAASEPPALPPAASIDDDDADAFGDDDIILLNPLNDVDDLFSPAEEEAFVFFLLKVELLLLLLLFDVEELRIVCEETVFSGETGWDDGDEEVAVFFLLFFDGDGRKPDFTSCFLVTSKL